MKQTHGYSALCGHQRWRQYGALTAWLALTACAPDDIARATCRGEMLTLGEPEHCTVSARWLGRASAIHFDSESRNHLAQVKINLHVAKGTLRLGYSDLEGPHQVSITPETPFVLSMQTRMHRETRSFTLDFAPQGGTVEGLSGTVDFWTPVAKQ